jgi:hypothetical protein
MNGVLGKASLSNTSGLMAVPYDATKSGMYQCRAFKDIES